MSILNEKRIIELKSKNKNGDHGKKKSPDIVFILEDHQSFYAYGEHIDSIPIQKPNYNRIASEGIEFTFCLHICSIM